MSSTTSLLEHAKVSCRELEQGGVDGSGWLGREATRRGIAALWRRLSPIRSPLYSSVASLRAESLNVLPRHGLTGYIR